METTISSQLNIADHKADELIILVNKMIKEKSFAHEILKDLVCSDLNTSELVFSCYIAGAIVGKMKAEITNDEIERLITLAKLMSK